MKKLFSTMSYTAIQCCSSQLVDLLCPLLACIAGNQVTAEDRKHLLIFRQDFVVSLCHLVMHLCALCKGSISIIGQTKQLPLMVCYSYNRNIPCRVSHILILLAP